MPVAVTRISGDRVVVAVDPHKASWTAAAVMVHAAGGRACAGRPRRLSGAAPVAHRWPHARWAIEGAAVWGAAERGWDDGIEVIDVPAKLAARVRVLSSAHGRENDDADARSVAMAALTSPALGTPKSDAATTGLRAVVEHHDDLVKTRTQTVDRLQSCSPGWFRLVPGATSTRIMPPNFCAAATPRRPPLRPARPGDRSGRRGPPARSPHHQGRQ